MLPYRPADPVGTNELFYQVLDRLAKLEKDMTGKALDPNEVLANNSFYGMPPNYFSGQSPPPPDMSKPKTANAEGMASGGSAAGQTAPPGGQTTGTGNQTAFASGQIKPTNALEIVPSQPLPLSTALNLNFNGHTGTLSTAGATYSITVNSTQSGNVIPDQVFDAHLNAQNRNMPHLNYVNHTSAKQNSDWAEFNKFKE
jgi:hypothetical protein